MHSMPICFHQLTYTVKHYGLRGGKIKLKDKVYLKKTEEVCIGENLKEINNQKYNSYLLNNLKERNAKSKGCEIKIIESVLLSRHGETNKRFKDE